MTGEYAEEISRAESAKNAAQAAGKEEVGGENINNIFSNEANEAGESTRWVTRYFDDVQLKTEPNKAYFWSGNTNGIGGKDFAKDYAIKNGGTTLEEVMQNQGIKMPIWDINDPVAIKVWEGASAIYASQVSGEVRAIIGRSMRSESVWQTIELPKLMNNPNVTRIIIIDPETLAETIIFRR